MTIAELINQIKDLPKDMPVLVDDGETIWTPDSINQKEILETLENPHWNFDKYKYAYPPKTGFTALVIS